MTAVNSLDGTGPAGPPDLEGQLERFDAAWRGGSAPRIEAFLPPTGDAARRELLEELVQIDLEYRWRRAQPPANPDDPPTVVDEHIPRPAGAGCRRGRGWRTTSRGSRTWARSGRCRWG